MAVLSTGLVNSYVNANGLRLMMNWGHIKVYSGDPPADADAAVVGTHLATITRGGLPWVPNTQAPGIELQLTDTGVISPVAGSSVRMVGVASGIARWFRWYWNGIDSGEFSTFFPRIDGLIGIDLVLQSANITPATDVQISMLRLRQPKR